MANACCLNGKLEDFLVGERYLPICGDKLPSVAAFLHMRGLPLLGCALGSDCANELSICANALKPKFPDMSYALLFEFETLIEEYVDSESPTACSNIIRVLSSCAIELCISSHKTTSPILRQ